MTTSITAYLARDGKIFASKEECDEHSRRIDHEVPEIQEELYKAVREEDIERLLGEGAEIDYQDADGWTALLVALNNHSYKTVLFLLEKGADPSIKTKAGKSGLDFIAFQPYELEVVFKLYAPVR